MCTYPCLAFCVRLSAHPPAHVPTRPLDRESRYEVSGGCIKIAGEPVSYYNPVWLRSQIGLSKQTPAIFWKSLRDNIMYGSEEKLRKLGGRSSVDAHIEQVLRAANIWDHFTNREKFPQGLNTPCDDDTLSGGEARSVGTARALLSNPSILLLDEPTSGLDAQNEQIVMENLIDKRPSGQTIIAIAHRLSTLRCADQIVYLGKDGTVLETGTWDELCAIPDGNFATFVKIQSLEKGLSVLPPMGGLPGGLPSGLPGSLTVGLPGQQQDGVEGPHSAASSPAQEGAAQSLSHNLSRSLSQHSNSLSPDPAISAVTAMNSESKSLSPASAGRDGRDLHDGQMWRSASDGARLTKLGPRGDTSDAVYEAAGEAVRRLRKLVRASDVPSRHILALADACENILDYQRVLDLASTGGALFWDAGLGSEASRLRAYAGPGTAKHARSLPVTPQPLSRASSSNFLPGPPFTFDHQEVDGGETRSATDPPAPPRLVARHLSLRTTSMF